MKKLITKEITRKIDTQLKEYSEKLKLPGMAVVASKQGELIYEYYYGYRDVEKRLPVTGETVFGLASITKSFASLAIMQLQDNQKLSVKDPVRKWITNFSLPGDKYSDQVRIHHLMTHTGGLPGLPVVHQARLHSILKDPDGRELFGNDAIYGNKQITTVEELVEEIKKLDVDLIGKPGEMFNYSNESYALLQQIIEEASGMAFLDYMDEHILHPLKMNRSSFLTEDLKKMDNVTEIYAYDSSKDKEFFHSPLWWDVGEIYTNGSLKASAYDLIKYATMYGQEGVYDGKQVLSTEAIRVMTSPQVITPNDIKYGYGLTVGEQFGERVLGHGGGIKGVSSYFLVVPERKLSIVVLINIAEAPAENMALITLRKVLQLTEEKLEVSPISMEKEQLNNYLGKYASFEGQKVEVRMVDQNKIALVMDEQEVLLRPIGNHKFITPDGKRVAFIEEAGKIKAIFRGLRYIEKVE